MAPCKYAVARHVRRLRLGVRVLLLFAAVEVGLRTRPLPALCRLLGLAFRADSPPMERGARLDAGQVMTMVRAVNAVSAHWPAGDTCLRRCLVLGRLVRDAQPVLVVGVKRMADHRIGAHAWLEVGGRSIDPSAASFAALHV